MAHVLSKLKFTLDNEIIVNMDFKFSFYSEDILKMWLSIEDDKFVNNFSKPNILIVCVVVRVLADEKICTLQSLCVSVDQTFCHSVKLFSLH